MNQSEEGCWLGVDGQSRHSRCGARAPATSTEEMVVGPRRAHPGMRTTKAWREGRSSGWHWWSWRLKLGHDTERRCDTEVWRRDMGRASVVWGQQCRPTRWRRRLVRATSAVAGSSAAFCGWRVDSAPGPTRHMARQRSSGGNHGTAHVREEWATTAARHSACERGVSRGDGKAQRGSVVVSRRTVAHTQAMSKNGLLWTVHTHHGGHRGHEREVLIISSKALRDRWRRNQSPEVRWEEEVVGKNDAAGTDSLGDVDHSDLMS
jgi:hypothetical protein